MLPSKLPDHQELDVVVVSRQTPWTRRRPVQTFVDHQTAFFIRPSSGPAPTGRNSRAPRQEPDQRQARPDVRVRQTSALAPGQTVRRPGPCRRRQLVVVRPRRQTSDQTRRPTSCPADQYAVALRCQTLCRISGPSDPPRTPAQLLNPIKPYVQTLSSTRRQTRRNIRSSSSGPCQTSDTRPVLVVVVVRYRPRRRRRRPSNHQTDQLTSSSSDLSSPVVPDRQTSGPDARRLVVVVVSQTPAVPCFSSTPPGRRQTTEQPDQAVQTACPLPSSFVRPSSPCLSSSDRAVVRSSDARQTPYQTDRRQTSAP